jgi:hypothetical protein
MVVFTMNLDTHFYPGKTVLPAISGNLSYQIYAITGMGMETNPPPTPQRLNKISRLSPTEEIFYRFTPSGKGITPQ